MKKSFTADREPTKIIVKRIPGKQTLHPSVNINPREEEKKKS